MSLLLINSFRLHKNNIESGILQGNSNFLSVSETIPPSNGVNNQMHFNYLTHILYICVGGI